MTTATDTLERTIGSGEILGPADPQEIERFKQHHTMPDVVDDELTAQRLLMVQADCNIAAKKREAEKEELIRPHLTRQSELNALYNPLIEGWKAMGKRAGDAVANFRERRRLEIEAANRKAIADAEALRAEQEARERAAREEAQRLRDEADRIAREEVERLYQEELAKIQAEERRVAEEQAAKAAALKAEQDALAAEQAKRDAEAAAEAARLATTAREKKAAEEKAKQALAAKKAAEEQAEQARKEQEAADRKAAEAKAEQDRKEREAAEAKKLAEARQVELEKQAGKLDAKADNAAAKASTIAPVLRSEPTTTTHLPGGGTSYSRMVETLVFENGMSSDGDYYLDDDIIAKNPKLRQIPGGCWLLDTSKLTKLLKAGVKVPGCMLVKRPTTVQRSARKA